MNSFQVERSVFVREAAFFLSDTVVCLILSWAVVSYIIKMSLDRVWQMLMKKLIGH